METAARPESAIGAQRRIRAEAVAPQAADILCQLLGAGGVPNARSATLDRAGQPETAQARLVDDMFDLMPMSPFLSHESNQLRRAPAPA